MKKNAVTSHLKLLLLLHLYWKLSLLFYFPMLSPEKETCHWNSVPRNDKRHFSKKKTKILTDTNIFFTFGNHERVSDNRMKIVKIFLHWTSRWDPFGDWVPALNLLEWYITIKTTTNLALSFRNSSCKTYFYFHIFGKRTIPFGMPHTFKRNTCKPIKEMTTL